MGDLDALLRTIDRYKSSWQLGDKVRGLGPDVPRLLWEAYQAGRIELGLDSALWSWLAKAPDAYSAEDVLMLIRSIERHYPGGVKQLDRGSAALWGEGSLPGLVPNLRPLIEAKLGDDAFAATLRDGWVDLPTPYDAGLAYQLAQLEILSHDSLPPTLLDLAASTHVRHGAGDKMHWRRPAVWPDDLWGPALVKAAMEPVALENPRVLYDIAPHATADQLLNIAHRVGFGPNAWDGVDALVDVLGREALASLELAITRLPIPSRYEWRRPCPEFTLICSYMLGCRRHDQVPSEAVDAQVGAFVASYQAPFSGEAFESFHARLRDALAVVGVDRLERLLLAAPELPWVLAPAAPTEAVTARAVDAVLAIAPTQRWRMTEVEALLVGGGWGGRGTGVLHHLAAHHVEVFSTAVSQGQEVAQRLLLVKALAGAGDDRAVSGLVEALLDGAKVIRETASEGLLRLSTPDVVEALAPLIDARKKQTRLAAAEVLASVGPSVRAQEIARTRLPKEKVAAVRKLLEGIDRTQQTRGEDRTKKIARALVSSKGKDWRKHKTHGPGTVPSTRRSPRCRFATPA